MNGTVAPPSSSSIAALTCAGLATISSAIRCSMVCMIFAAAKKRTSVHFADQPSGAKEELVRVIAAVEPVCESRIERAAPRQIVIDCAEQLMRVAGAALRAAGKF